MFLFSFFVQSVFGFYSFCFWYFAFEYGIQYRLSPCAFKIHSVLLRTFCVDRARSFEHVWINRLQNTFEIMSIDGIWSVHTVHTMSMCLSLCVCVQFRVCMQNAKLNIVSFMDFYYTVLPLHTLEFRSLHSHRHSIYVVQLNIISSPCFILYCAVCSFLRIDCDYKFWTLVWHIDAAT